MKFQFSPYIAIQISEQKKAVDFYQRVLGMNFVHEEKNDVYLNKDGINFVFEDAEGRNGVFFEFKVDCVNDAREILEKEGCKVIQVYNEKSMMVSDPYGMNFHIWEDGAFPNNP